MNERASRPLLIIKAGDTHASLREHRGDFEHWIADGLSTALPLQVLDPRRGDTLPPPSDVAGIVLTGSHAMVSHREDWSESTATWLAAQVGAGVPVLGICYGHQLLAHALGGQADDHPVGLELGTVEIELAPEAGTDALFADAPPRFPVHVVHRQSALKLPEGAVRLAGNGWEPHQAFRVGEHAWGVQFHPEFDADTMRGYVQLLGGTDDPRRDGVRDTAEAAALLGRFARVVERREAAARDAARPVN